MKKCFPAFKAVIMLITVFCLATGQSYGQSKVGQWYLQSARTIEPQTVAIFEPLYLERPNPLVTNYLQLNLNEFSSLLTNNAPLIDLYIPYGTSTVKLNLAKVSTTASTFGVVSDKGDVSYTPGVHYRGIVNDDPNSIAAISVFENNVMGFYSTDEGNFTIGKMEDGSGNYCVYSDKELPSLGSFDCGAIELSPNKAAPAPSVTGIGCKTVTVYVECDYALFVNKGSNATTLTNYVNGLFNQVSALYANDNVDLQISQIFIWTTPDPYASLTSTSSILNSFKANKGANFNGNLAHFLTTRNVGGGIAYVDVLCNKPYAFGVSMIYSSYSTVPTYSWSVEVVTHELGHNIASPHTQSCSWPGGAIDNCYATEGGCAPGPAPINGGTIMSYCHLASYGINFNNGFGPLPGNLIRDRVLNSSCLVSSGTAPTGLSATNLTTSSAQLGWVAVNGATQYTVEYRLAGSFSWLSAGTTTGMGVTVSGLAANANYEWHVKTDCSPYSASSAFTTLAGAGCATPTGLATSNITQSSSTLSWGAVTGATSYTVEYKTSSTSTWTATITTNTSIGLNGLAAGTTYNWRVKADCSSLSSAISFTTLSAPTGCIAPINLTATNVANKTATLTWATVPGALSYSVKFRKIGAANWTNYNNITGTFKNVNKLTPNSTYEWTVATNCSGQTSNLSSVSTFTTPAKVGKFSEDESDDIRVYPNPATSALTLEISNWNIDDAGIGEVFNIQGSKIKSIPLTVGQNKIDLTDMADGLYLLSIKKDGAETVTRKFMKSSK